MDYTIENELLKLTVTTKGAQVKSVIRKCDNVEHMWNADPSVWGYHAPVLFPHAGALKDGKLEAKGKVYESKQHGFTRLLEHKFVSQTSDTITLELTDSEETRKSWPYSFRLLSTFRLEGDTLHHTLTVENRDDEKMPFGIGFHPAYAMPFDDKHTTEDYELRFSQVESPMVLQSPKGLLTGECGYVWNNIRSIPVTEHLFDNDSYCMTGLKSGTLGLYEKDTGRAVVCNIKDFPYVLIWSKPGKPHFLCIEPWNSLPSPENGGIKWEEKPAAAVLEPGENWSTTLSTTFQR